MTNQIYPEPIATIRCPEPFEPCEFTDAEEAVAALQTLYDRYLIVDKKIKPAKRLETPQLFWMRVAMGLNVGERDGNPQRTM